MHLASTRPLTGHTPKEVNNCGTSNRSKTSVVDIFLRRNDVGTAQRSSLTRKAPAPLVICSLIEAMECRSRVTMAPEMKTNKGTFRRSGDGRASVAATPFFI